MLNHLIVGDICLGNPLEVVLPDKGVKPFGGENQGLGHADLNTTNRYATIDIEMKRKAIESIQPLESKGTRIQPWRNSDTILEWLESL